MSQNLQRQLDSIIGTKGKQFASPTLFGSEKMGLPTQGYKSYMPSFSSGTTVLDNLKQISISSRVFYILISIFVVLFILIAIHLFVYPFLPDWVLGTQLPGMNDEKIYWNTQATKEPILPADQPIADISHDYTFMFDIQVDNPTTRLGQHRIFLNRGSPVTTNGGKLRAYQQDSGEGNIQSLVPSYNFIVYFDKGSTDLYIGTILNDNTQSPKIIIPNFPIQKSVRVTVVLMNKAMEIYLNGELYSTKSFIKSIKPLKGTIYPPTIDSGTAPFGRLHNLRLWRRTLGVSEIRSYGAGTSFDKVDITDTCVS